MPTLPQQDDAEDSASNLATRTFSRRKFLRRTVGGATAGALLYTWRVEPHWVEFVHRPMPIWALPEALAGKRLIQVSDLHAGPIVDQSFLTASLERIADLDPDLIVLTGDFMSCYGDEEIPKALDVIRALPPAPLGRFAVLGNHDYGYRWKQLAVADQLAEGLEQLDVRLLRNEVANVGGLQLLGVDEFWSGRFHPETALAALDTARASIALCHNPDGADHSAWEDYQGWILSGHTHGGQCKPPWLPPPFVPVQNRRYVAGEYELADGRQLYINRGLGYLKRVRFNCRPEITVFTLQRAEG